MADAKSTTTLSMPETTVAEKPVAPAEPSKEREVSVELLSDVWVSDDTHEDSVGGIRRIRTNLPVLDENGNPKIDKATKTMIVTHATASLPVSLAKKLIDSGKAKRADPL